MNMDEERLRLTGSGVRPGSGFTGFITKLVTFTIGALLLAGALMISLFVFAVAAMVALLVGGYIFWKTRALRKQMRERSWGGRVIEGEVVEGESTDRRAGL